jgi:hypothetical protein
MKLKNRLRFSLCGITIFVFCSWVHGQDSLSHDRIGAAYLSEGGLYPGFTFTFERTLLANKTMQLLAAAKTGAYFHHRNHTGIFFMVQSGQRFKLYKNISFEHFIGIGYLHSFLNGGDAYSVNASGQVQKVHDLGNPHLMPSVSFGLSYAANQKRKPLLFYGRPMVFWQIPFNRVSLVQFAVEFGVLMHLKK